MAIIDTIVKSEETNMTEIDTDELRDYLEDYCGTAASSGFPAALLDVADIENHGRLRALRKGRRSRDRPAAIRG